MTARIFLKFTFKVARTAGGIYPTLTSISIRLFAGLLPMNVDGKPRAGDENGRILPPYITWS
jgi:hypothetical protein